MTTHLYLSPHFDDAIFSCGATMVKQTGQGEQVVVTTVCANSPRDTELSPFAKHLHEQMFADSVDVVLLRRSEDEAACRELGVSLIHLSEVDCIYRCGPDGRWLYPDEEAVFGDIHPDDAYDNLEKALNDLRNDLSPDCVYAPLAVGNHVDHQRVRYIAERWSQQGVSVLFYEDYPYIEQADHLWQALNKPVPGTWERRPEYLSAVEVTSKIQALSHYQSQLAFLFASPKAMQIMPRRIRIQLARTGNPNLAEGFWRLSGNVTKVID